MCRPKSLPALRERRVSGFKVPGSYSHSSSRQASTLLLRFPSCDGILEKGSVPFAKMFQSFLLVGIQSGFNFGQRCVESVARLLDRKSVV